MKAPKSSLGVFYVILTRRTVPVRKEWVIFLIIGGWHLNLSPLRLARSLTHTHTDTKVISTPLNSSPDTDNMEVLMYQKIWSHERRHTHTHTDTHTHTCSLSCVHTHTHTHTHNSRHTGSCGAPVRLTGQVRWDWRGLECGGGEPGRSRICCPSCSPQDLTTGEGWSYEFGKTRWKKVGVRISKPAGPFLTRQHSAVVCQSATLRGWLCNCSRCCRCIDLQGNSVHVCKHANIHTYGVKDLV